MFECYLDMYTLTGAHKYLSAVQGGWEMYRDPQQGWMFPGGSVALNENYLYPPGALPLEFQGSWGVHSRPTGELCPSAFWVKLNQRLHRLFPDQEVYYEEIERTLYNVALAGQGVGGAGVRYFARLHGHKEPPTAKGTCCEGQSTRIFGGVPELIFSQDAGAPWAVRVNLFEPSTLRTTSRGGVAVNVSILTAFPSAAGVQVLVSPASALASGDFACTIRVPAWVSTPTVAFSVNGGPPVEAPRGSYAAIAPPPGGWAQGGTWVSFSLPMAPKEWPYGGATQVAGFTRSAYTFGPFLLAVLGPWDAGHDGIVMSGAQGGAASPQEWLLPAPGTAPGALAANFSVAGVPGASVVPYYFIQSEQFTCYPLF